MKVTDAINRAEMNAAAYGGQWRVVKYSLTKGSECLLIQCTSGVYPENGETLYITEESGTNVHIPVGEG